MTEECVKERLLELAKECWPDAVLEENGLVTVGAQLVDLNPVLRLFERIPNSPDFTHLPPLFNASENFPITDMYVELMVARTRGVAQPLLLQKGKTIAEEQEARYQQHISRNLNIHQCINFPQHKHIVVLGDPGSGKTSLLRYLCLEIATGKSQRWLVPIFISLKAYWLEKQKDETLSLTHYAAISIVGQQSSNNVSTHYSLLRGEAYQAALDQHAGFEALLLALSGNGKKHILFLLDGFDEIATYRDAIETVSAEIRQLGNRFSWVLTSRHTGYFGGVNEDICYDIMSLNKAGIEELVDSWFAHSGLTNNQLDKKNLLSEINVNPRLREMAANPFLLTLLCYIRQHHSERKLPMHRADVYENIIHLMRQQLRYKEEDNALFGKLETDYLSKFCLYLYTDAQYAPLQLFEYEHWDSCASPDIPPDFRLHFEPSRLIRSWRQHGDFHFVHLTFQEYLIAVEIARQSFDGVQDSLFKPHWKMVFRFLAGIYSQKNAEGYLKVLLQTLLSPVDQMGVLYLEAARLLIEAGVEDSTNLLGYDLRDELWELWLGNSDYVKESAGEVLAMLSPRYVVKRLVDFYQGNVNKQAAYEVVSGFVKVGVGKVGIPYQFCRSIRLLGFVHHTEADALIVQFLKSDHKETRAMAIGAIAEKNSSELRQAVIDLYNSDQEKYFHLLCAIARETKHKIFIQYLKPYLDSKPEDIESYDGLFRAITTIGSVEFADGIFRLASACSVEELSDDLVEAVLSLQTREGMKWLSESLESDDEELKELVAYQAIRHSLLAENDLLRLLKNEKGNSLSLYLTALLEQVQKGGKLTLDLMQVLMEIASVNIDESVRALTVLEQSDFSELSGSPELGNLSIMCRDYMHHPDIEMSISSIAILGSLCDAEAFNGIKALAFTGNQYGVQSIAIEALGRYGTIRPVEVKEALHSLYQMYQDKDGEHVADDILSVLAEVDLKEVYQYLGDSGARETMTSFCARQGVLLFEDGYIDNVTVHALLRGWQCIH